MNKEKMLCVKNVHTNEYGRVTKSEADILVSKKGFTYLSKSKFKQFLNKTK